MTDEQFIARLIELEKQGVPGVPPMREILRGQMGRLIALAARGMKAKEVKETADQRKRHIPDGFPDAAAKDAAVEYWAGRRRPDLVVRVEEMADGFYTHHYIRNVRYTRWDMAWKTWYVRAISIEKPPREAGLYAIAPIVFEQTDLNGWKCRLEIFYIGDEELPAGGWSPKWGPEPDKPGCRAPAEALRMFSEKKQGKLL